MVKTKEMGLRERVIKLRKFIEDGKLLGFNPFFITNLRLQLSELESEQNRDKSKRVAFYKSIKLQNYNNQSLKSALTSPICTE